jgi:DNA mismatch repair protein MutL
MCCTPDVTRPGRGQLTVIVNGRWVQPRGLLATIETAYRPLLPRGRHPVLIVLIDAPSDRVDINVHPSKHEVRLLDEAAFGAAIGDHLRQAFGHQPRSIDARAWATVDLGPGVGASDASPGIREQGDDWDDERPITTPHLPPLRLVGQVHNRVILVEGPGGLYLIDQHRAHERVLYERLRTQHGTGSPELQALPEPLVLELTPHQVARFGDRLAQLAEFGFDCDVFGSRTFLVRAMPVLPGYVPRLGDAAGDTTVASSVDLIATLAEPSELRPLLLALADEPAADGEDWRERLLVTLSCRNALRRGRPLTRPAMRTLVQALGQTSAPAVCPHGSPLLVHLSGSLIERQFGWR